MAVKSWADSSLLFTTLHPHHFLKKTHYINNGSVIYYDQHQSSIMTSSSHQWWPSFAIRWRVVKSGEECLLTLHLSQPQCLSGFQGNLWRVKSEIESGVFLTQTDSTCNQKASANRNNSPIEIYLPTYYFMPGNGTILPQLRATLCHSQAKSGISLLSHLNRAHLLMPHTLLAE